MIISYILALCKKDGIMNNGETGVDCGGGACQDCGKFGVHVTLQFIIIIFS